MQEHHGHVASRGRTISSSPRIFVSADFSLPLSPTLFHAQPPSFDLRLVFESPYVSCASSEKLTNQRGYDVTTWLWNLGAYCKEIEYCLCGWLTFRAVLTCLLGETFSIRGFLNLHCRDFPGALLSLAFPCFQLGSSSMLRRFPHHMGPGAAQFTSDVSHLKPWDSSSLPTITSAKQCHSLCELPYMVSSLYRPRVRCFWTWVDCHSFPFRLTAETCF